MFYSHSLLSRKGPLGNIWIAAYCFKRLRRDQIASTDISSSIDKIHSQAKLSYRVLGYLLLGVVRIYSWKVEYLYKDCEEVLTYISRCAIPKEHVRKHRRGIVVGKEVIRPSTRNATSSEKAMPAEPMETMRAPYHAITAPGSFELDAFELEDMDEGEKTTRRHKKSMIQDNLVENHEDSFRSENYQRVPIAHTDFSLVCFTPVEDVLPSDVMNIDLEINQLKDSGIAEGRRQEPRRDFWHLVEFGNPESLGPKMSLGLNIHEEEHDHPVDLPEFQERVSSDINQDMHESVGPIICLSSNLQNKEQSHQIDTSDLQELVPLGINQDRHTKESQNQLRPHNLRVRILPVHDKSPEIREAQDRSPDKSNSPHEAGLASPKFTVTTPAKREQRKVLRKRKGYFDETIVLSNATLRQAIHDASNLVCKRRKMPQTVLDTWKSSKITNLQHNFMDPLIPFVSPDLKALLLKKLSNNRPVRKYSPSINQEVNMQDVPRDVLDSDPIQPRTADSPAPETYHEVSTSKLQDVPSNVLNVEGTIQQRISPETKTPASHEGITTSERQDVPINVLDLHGPVHQRTAAETSTPVSRHDVSPSNKLEEVKVRNSDKETSDSGADLLDLELGARETGSSSNQGSIGDDGSPLRTRAMVQYLHDKFQNSKEQKLKGMLSFTQILEGKTRAESARYFYEILCLKDRRYIDVKQDSPYGDITLSPTPELDTMFKNL